MSRQQTGKSLRAKLFHPQPGDEITLGPFRIIVTWRQNNRIEAYIRNRRTQESGTVKIYKLADWVSHWEQSAYLHGGTA